MNYTTLYNAVQTYLDNQEAGFVALIPTFVKMAEKRIYQEAQLPVSAKNSIGNFTASTQYLAVPTDYLTPDSLSVTVSSEQSFLEFVDKSFIRECYPNASTTGVPKYYAIFSDTAFIIGPTPASNYVAELHYFGYPTSIVDAGTSWLGTNFENTLFYGTLVEAYRQMKGDTEILASYEKAYQEDLAKLKVFSAARSRNDAYRMGQFAAPLEM